MEVKNMMGKNGIAHIANPVSMLNLTDHSSLILDSMLTRPLSDVDFMSTRLQLNVDFTLTRLAVQHLVFYVVKINRDRQISFHNPVKKECLENDIENVW